MISSPRCLLLLLLLLPLSCSFCCSTQRSVLTGHRICFFCRSSLRSSRSDYLCDKLFFPFDFALIPRPQSTITSWSYGASIFFSLFSFFPLQDLVVLGSRITLDFSNLTPTTSVGPFTLLNLPPRICRRNFNVLTQRKFQRRAFAIFFKTLSITFSFSFPNMYTLFLQRASASANDSFNVIMSFLWVFSRLPSLLSVQLSSLRFLLSSAISVHLTHSDLTFKIVPSLWTRHSVLILDGNSALPSSCSLESCLNFRVALQKITIPRLDRENTNDLINENDQITTCVLNSRSVTRCAIFVDLPHQAEPARSFPRTGLLARKWQWTVWPGKLGDRALLCLPVSADGRSLRLRYVHAASCSSSFLPLFQIPLSFSLFFSPFSLFLLFLSSFSLARLQRPIWNFHWILTVAETIGDNKEVRRIADHLSPFRTVSLIFAHPLRTDDASWCNIESL